MISTSIPAFSLLFLWCACIFDLCILVNVWETRSQYSYRLCWLCMNCVTDCERRKVIGHWSGCASVMCTVICGLRMCQWSLHFMQLQLACHDKWNLNHVVEHAEQLFKSLSLNLCIQETMQSKNCPISDKSNFVEHTGKDRVDDKSWHYNWLSMWEKVKWTTSLCHTQKSTTGGSNI